MALTEPLSADVKIGGQTVSKWRFDLIKDEVPSINLMGTPTTTPRGALRLVYRRRRRQWRGERRGALRARRRRGAQSRAGAGRGRRAKVDADPLLEPPVMPLQLPRTNAKRVDGKATQDLTAHPWAGLKVLMTLVARDQAGQMGESMPYEFVLPERKFTKPLAKAVVEQRKKLVRDPNAPEAVANALDALTLGGDKVIDDSTVYLALRNAYWRLRSDTSRDGIASVVEQLWSTALRIEEGDLPEAERAVNAGAGRADAGAAGERLRRRRSSSWSMSCARRCRAISRRSPRSSKTRATCRRKRQQDGDQLVSQQDLDKMLKNIQNLAQSGSKEMAERMLSELKDILDRLQTGNFAENAQQQRAEPHDEGFERHRLQSAETARRHVRRQAPAGRLATATARNSR